MLPIIDTHQHLWDLDRFRLPWLKDATTLARSFLMDDYLKAAEGLGVVKSVYMEVDVDPADIEAETAYVAAKAKDAGSLLRGAIASCRPEETGFGAYLERQRQNPFVKGFRRVLHVMPDELSESATFRSNINLLSGSGLPFDLCVLPHQIPKAIALADLAPDVQFVLDHCGVPDIKGGAEHPWRGHITEIARRPNVVAKISGVVAYSGEEWTVETLRPWVEHTIDAFGWDRVVWGSDWPVCTLGGGLSTWIAATHALIAGASTDEKTKLLSANARRVWRL